MSLARRITHKAPPCLLQVRGILAPAKSRYAKLPDQTSADRSYLCLIDNVPASIDDVQVLPAAKERRTK